MTIIRVFDPAMCCSTGICGPSVDPELVRFAADLDWLKSRGVSVERFNLSQQPAAFAADAAAKAALETRGEAGLPLIQVNGEVKSSGVFPSRRELAAWAGVATDPMPAGSEQRSSACCSSPTAATSSGNQQAGGCAPAASPRTQNKSGCC